MPRVHLTDVTLRSLKPTERYVTYWDTKLPGFGVRVGLKSKTFIVMRGEERRRISVGSYPDKPLAEARKEAYPELLPDVRSIGSPTQRKLFCDNDLI